MKITTGLCLALAVLAGVPPLLAQPATFPDRSVLDVNNMSTWVRSDGNFIRETVAVPSNVVYPKGTGGVVFQQGLLWGGVRRTPDGARKVLVNGNVYSSGLDRGRVRWDPVTGAVEGPDDPANTARYHVWRVHRAWMTLDLRAAAASYFNVAPPAVTEEQQEQVRQWYAYDWENWPAEMGAPYEERNGIPGYQAPDYDADAGSWTGDLPGHAGADQTVWLVANDFSSASETYGSEPFGLEYQVTLWAYDMAGTTAAGNTHFARHRLVYTGLPATPQGTSIDSMFVAQWADTDVGDYSDDYAGSDTVRALGYVYNATDLDAVFFTYEMKPPAIGWSLLQGPVAGGGTPGADTLGMTAFVHFATGDAIGDPDMREYQGTLQWFNMMRGHQPRPAYPADAPFVDPHTGSASVFTVPGDPVQPTGWIDGFAVPAGDRRIAVMSGPFSMQLGDTVDVVFAQIGASGTSNLGSVTLLKSHADLIRSSYEGGSNPVAAEPAEKRPHMVSLRGNTPNPFRSGTDIRFDLPEAASVSVTVYNLLGREVARTPPRPFGPGAGHRLPLDAAGLPSGVYVYRVSAGMASGVEVRTGRFVVAR